MNRVVVTGLGLVTPLGCGVQNSWNALISGKCGIQRLESSEYDKIPSKVAARVPRGGSHPASLNSEKYVLPSELRTMSPASLFALVASDEAIKDANITEDDDLRHQTGVAVGMGMSDLEYIVESAFILRDKGPSRISPYFVPRILNNMAAGIISIRHKLEGPNHSVSTACATGAHSIGKMDMCCSHDFTVTDTFFQKEMQLISLGMGQLKPWSVEEPNPASIPSAWQDFLG